MLLRRKFRVAAIAMYVSCLVRERDDIFHHLFFVLVCLQQLAKSIQLASRVSFAPCHYNRNDSENKGSESETNENNFGNHGRELDHKSRG